MLRHRINVALWDVREERKSEQFEDEDQDEDNQDSDNESMSHFWARVNADFMRIRNEGDVIAEMLEYPDDDIHHQQFQMRARARPDVARYIDDVDGYIRQIYMAGRE